MDDWKSVLVEFAALEVEFGAELSEQFAVTELDTGPMLDIAAQGLESLALPIPSIFYSLHDGPFERCLVCKTELLTAPVEYEIVRLFRLEEPVTEYAICVGCCDPLWDGFSGETRDRLADEFRRRVDWETRRMRMISAMNFLAADIEPWIAECLFTGKPRQECHIYQVVATCIGPHLLPWDRPYMRSGESLRDTRSMWSKGSRGKYDDFVEEFLGPTPSLAKETPWPLALTM